VLLAAGIVGIGEAGDEIVDAVAAGAVGAERIAPAVEFVAPGIAHALDEDLEVEARGPEPPDAAPPSRRVPLGVSMLLWM
jgi:hypothetical protein